MWVFAKCSFLSLLLVQGILSQNKPLSDVEYYVGVSEGMDLAKVRSDAYHSLVQQIQVFVTSEIRTSKRESGQFSIDSTSLNTIARSSIILTDVGEIVENVNGELFRVKRFVSKESVKKMFELRRQRMLDFVRIADDEISSNNSAAAVNVGLTLKNYYWALLLAQITPDVTASSISAQLPNKIEAVARNIVFRAMKRIDDENVVWKYGVEYKGRRVSNLRYSFFDGMGQTDAEVTKGETKLTFYFPGRDDREREIDLTLEYRYEDEMDELVRLADSTLGGRSMPTTVVLMVPGEKGTEPAPLPRPPHEKVSILIPQALRPLLADHKNFEETKGILDKLVKEGKIITGRANDFETLDGLYALVVGREGVLALLQCVKGKYYNAQAETEVTLREFAGKRIVWIDLLR